ncbi:hypothetical protein [Longimicrobium terrae]|uniref:Uncharacterized protein n=1 Tax=Longimicrobium terrae TaxID=1639882 RepID=A0A841H112_9BACT|nr:hypothetical protein [Longimicrobium terrae]MBB4637295.1 hypothetical protein [Longimicrobium terrae]MBB6071693.1 hypothetical protein [Longimicrobium terrae]NNC28454.1 hypothetical protein [Longimicrobium terrae]
MQIHPLSVATAPDPPPARLSRLGRLSDWQFRTLLLAMGAVSALMVAEAAQTFAEMAERNATLSTRWAAISPVAYGSPLPALHALAPALDESPRILLRADAEPAGREARCALAAEAGRGPNIRWIALAAPVEPCVVRAFGNAVLRGDGTAAREFGTARWIVLDAGGVARYSSRNVPSPQRLRSTAALLAPSAESGR